MIRSAYGRYGTGLSKREEGRRAMSQDRESVSPLSYYVTLIEFLCPRDVIITSVRDCSHQETSVRARCRNIKPFHGPRSRDSRDTFVARALSDPVAREGARTLYISREFSTVLLTRCGRTLAARTAAPNGWLQPRTACLTIIICEPVGIATTVSRTEIRWNLFASDPRSALYSRTTAAISRDRFA